MSFAISSRVSGPYEVPAHSLSAPQTAMFNADEPAMPAPAGDSPRVVIVRPRDAEVVGEAPKERERGIGPQLVARRQQHLARRVFGDEGHALVRAALEPDVGAKADGGVQRLCAGVEKVERPDVDGAAGEINPCRRRRRDVHGAIIILQNHMPLTTRRDIGQLLIGSFPGVTIPVELRSMAREFDLGGVILFKRNVEGPDQVSELAAEAEALGAAHRDG